MTIYAHDSASVFCKLLPVGDGGFSGTPAISLSYPNVYSGVAAHGAEHVRQWKDTMVTMECGDPVPWPMFADFIHLRRTSASHCTCGTFQVMGVCEEKRLWLILKEPQFQVLLMYSLSFSQRWSLWSAGGGGGGSGGGVG